MTNEIMQKLVEIERTENVKILFAVESGSRGWGFASQDSDYDVRFVFIRPVEDYLSIDDKKDYIELPINEVLDINGWDIRKAFKLLRKSNPPLLEWLSSPIVYRNHYESIQTFIRLSEIFFAPLPALHHYLSLAKGTLNDIQHSERVKIKKYFYILRPLLACLWIEKYRRIPPMEYEKLLKAQEFDEELLMAFSMLYQKKIAGIESDPEPADQRIINFFTSQIQFIESYISHLEKTPQPDSLVLDEMFRDTLAKAWRLL